MDFMLNTSSPTTSNQSLQLFHVTFTSAVSLWQFLHERPMPEKALSGWSNLPSLALRKNVVKGSYRNRKQTRSCEKQPWVSGVCLVSCFQFISVLSRHSLFWASTSVLNELWSIRLCSGEEVRCRHPMSRSAQHKMLLVWDSGHRLARRNQREITGWILWRETTH